MSTRISLLEPKSSIIECFLGSNKISSSLYYKLVEELAEKHVSLICGYILAEKG